MGIQNFPAALQPIIQQGWLEKRFEDGIQSTLGYRAIARREDIPVKIGETITKTKPGLKAPVTTPMDPTTNTNLDNGLTSNTWTVEQYTLTMAMYGDTIDLNTVTDAVGIETQFTQNAFVNGVQSIQSLDRLARFSLFDAYMGGNTRVVTTLGAPAATIAVDDIRGFRKVFKDSILQAVAAGAGYTMPVLVGDTVYTLTGVTADGANVSTSPRGVSGTLTFSGNVSVANGTAGKAVVSAYAPTIRRPSARATTSDLVVGTDKMTMGLALDAVTDLRNQGVPPAEDGLYNVYMDNTSGRQLFTDPDFKLLYQGDAGASSEFRSGRVVELLGCRFIPTTEAFLQTLGAAKVHRPIVCGHGALVEGDFAGMTNLHAGPDTMVDVVDGIVQVTREPLDRLQQIIAQSWFWAGGFVAPTDQTVNSNIVPTATAAYYKRAIVLEHCE